MSARPCIGFGPPAPNVAPLVRPPKSRYPSVIGASPSSVLAELPLSIPKPSSQPPTRDDGPCPEAAIAGDRLHSLILRSGRKTPVWGARDQTAGRLGAYTARSTQLRWPLGKC